MICPKCGTNNLEAANFCVKCGAPLASTSATTPTTSPSAAPFLIVTTPIVAGYKITKVLGIVTGLTPRTRGVLGKFVASFESILGGEVTSFTSEMEKARWEAINRVKLKAQELGANAVIGLDVETSDIGLQSGIVLFSATGTAVVIQPE